MSTIKVNRIENTATTDGGIDIDSNGKIGIGTASPTFAAGGGIHNKGSNGAFTSFRASVDSNTGVDFAAANDGNGFIYNRDNANLSFGTNNTERLRITSDGKLGVGTSSPGQLLHLNSSASTAIQISDGTNNQFISSIKTAGNFANGSTAGDILIRAQSGFAVSPNNGSSVALRIDSSGNVGINDSSPSSLGTNITTVEVKGGSATRSGGIRLSTSDDSQKAAFYVYDGAGIVGTETAHPLGLYTGNTERLRIDSSGNVQIGTSTSNNYKLHLRTAGSSSVYQQFSNGNTGISGTDGFLVGIAADKSALLYQQEASPVRIFTNNAERLRIDSSGRLLVGTTAANDSTAQSNLVIESNSVSATSYGGLMLRRGSTSISSGTSLGRTFFADQSGNVGARISGLGDGTWASNDYPGAITFDTTADGASSPTERMRINAGGNVGIGTTECDVALHVAATAGGDVATVAEFENLGTGNNSATRLLIRTQSGSTNTDAYIQNTGSSGGNSNLLFATEGSGSLTERMRIHSGGQVEFKNGSFANNVDCVMANGGTMEIGAQSTIKFRIATNEKLRLDSSGNLLIGTTSVGGSGGISLRSNGHFIAPVCYSVGLSASPRDAFIDSNGELGYVPSIRKAKTNIQVQSNVDWLYQLEPVTFNYKTKDRETGNYTDKAEAELEYGLIAEDVETACPDLCFYDQTDNGPELRGVSYKKLITPILKALQDAKAEIETLKTKVAALEAG